jgi:acetyl-CoA C-acetyltransferase
MPMSRSCRDPFTEQPFGLSDIEISTFRLSRWLAAYPGAEAARTGAARARLARASANPRTLHGPSVTFPASFPLRKEEMPVWADVVAAVIVGREQGPVRVAGVGHGTDTPQIGARDLLGMPALKSAVEAATACADIQLGDVGIIELDGMTLSDEVIAMEALGLCAPGEGFASYSASDRVNVSGGGAGGWCYPAMGLVRFAEAYWRLRDGASASARGRKAALATGHGSNGAQTSTAVVLEAL